MPEGAVSGWFLRHWYGGSRLRWLQPFALLFQAATALRRKAYAAGLIKSQHPGVPVIVVGNLVVGGAGKTPLVIWLAQQIQLRGLQPGIALRGYGGSAKHPQRVTGGSDPAAVGDEAVLLARRTGCPVAVGAQRAAAAQLLVASGCTCVLADDGLQHLALRRDLEIVVIDGSRGLGNGALLPQGPLREKPHRLRSVAAVVINGEDATGIAARLSAPMSMTLAADELCSLKDDAPQPLQQLRGARVHAIAAIGNPQRFFSLLRSLGCEPVEHAFADHQALRQADLAFGDGLPVVMTEKDAVKCRHLATDGMLYLKLSATLPAADAGRLLQLVESCMTNGERIHA